MLLTEAGMTIDVRPQLLKALSPIVCKVLGRLMFSRLEQAENALLLISVNPSGKETLANLLH